MTGDADFIQKVVHMLEADKTVVWGKHSLAIVSSLRMSHRDVELAG
jgi:hypothetical protein